MITKTAQYALRALVTIASDPDRNHGAQELAGRIHAPPNYMGKLLKLLADAGILTSTRGSGGGFRLARPAREITLMDIVDPVDRVSRWSACFLGLGDCNPEDPCPIHHLWKPIRERYIKLLETSTLDCIPGSGQGLLNYEKLLSDEPAK
jgi:Rrf2 family protein